MEEYWLSDQGLFWNDLDLAHEFKISERGGENVDAFMQVCEGSRVEEEEKTCEPMF